MKLLIIWFSLILINFNLVNSQSSFHPQVNLYQGAVRGRQMRTENEKEFYGFLGIPYALPPTGPLRFKVGSQAIFFVLSLAAHALV